MGAALVFAAVAVVPTTTTVNPGAKGLWDDYNGDGYPDLAISAPQTRSPAGPNVGAVRVLYGSAGGPATPRLQVLDASQEYTESPQQGYGSALRSGDLDGDGYADLLSFVRWAPVDGDPGHNVTVNWGGPTGLSTQRTLLLYLPEATWTTGFTVRYIDGDKHLDVVTRGNDDGVPRRDGAVRYGPFTRDGAASGEDHDLQLEY
ncbi:FG-GAP repeat domain-containing protein [Streptomyces sp. NPDC059866]|uniref:FG-GAP repeat domain-containing protein n=1 Tax=Streptomyces sp. NPDC059866 TaxID=3346978 RepID=UPI0036461E83